MERSLPRYKFWVRFSVDTTSASPLRPLALRRSFAKSIAITEAEQPMPSPVYKGNERGKKIRSGERRQTLPKIAWITA